jgi:hypothetical protein
MNRNNQSIDSSSIWRLTSQIAIPLIGSYESKSCTDVGFALSYSNDLRGLANVHLRGDKPPIVPSPIYRLKSTALIYVVLEKFTSKVQRRSVGVYRQGNFNVLWESNREPIPTSAHIDLTGSVEPVSTLHESLHSLSELSENPSFVGCS